MNNNDSFGNIYDGMNRNHRKLEQIAEYFYNCIQEDPNNEMAKELFQGLMSALQDMLATEKDFISSYCEPNLKEPLMAQVDDKSKNITKALQEVMDKNR